MVNGVSMRAAISSGQWLAAGAMSDGAPPTRARIAAMLGCDVSAVHAHARRQNWRSADFRRPAAKAAWAHFMEVAFGQSDDPGSSLIDGHAPGRRRAGAGEASGDVVGEDQRGITDRADAGVEGPAAIDDGDIQCGGPEQEPDDGDVGPLEMQARLTKFMSRKLVELIRQAESGQPIGKQEIDNLVAMMRMTERCETLAKERAKKKETNRDAEIAQALRKIDRRILKLARDEAERLVAAGYRPPTCRRDQ